MFLIEGGLKALELELIFIGLLLKKLGVQLPLHSELSGLAESLPHSVTFFISRRKILGCSLFTQPVMEQSQLLKRILGITDKDPVSSNSHRSL